MKIGSPILGVLTVTPSGDVVRFDYTETDVAGQGVTAKRVTPQSVIDMWGARVNIIGLDGKPIDTIKLNWMPLETGKARRVSAKAIGSWQAEWRPPAGVTGPFTATVDRDAGPFPAQTKPVTFSIK